MFSLLLTGAVAVETENIVFSGVELPGVATKRLVLRLLGWRESA